MPVLFPQCQKVVTYDVKSRITQKTIKVAQVKRVQKWPKAEIEIPYSAGQVRSIKGQDSREDCAT